MDANSDVSRRSKPYLTKHHPSVHTLGPRNGYSISPILWSIPGPTVPIDSGQSPCSLTSPSPQGQKAFRLCFWFGGLLGQSWYEWFWCWGIGICFFSRTCFLRFGLSLRFGYFECPSSPCFGIESSVLPRLWEAGYLRGVCKLLLITLLFVPHSFGFRTDQAMNDVDHSRGGMVSLSRVKMRNLEE